MDDALVQAVEFDRNGETRTVLILVVMDDALVQIYDKVSGKVSQVLILVVMDDALVPENS